MVAVMFYFNFTTLNDLSKSAKLFIIVKIRPTVLNVLKQLVQIETVTNWVTIISNFTQQKLNRLLINYIINSIKRSPINKRGIVFERRAHKRAVDRWVINGDLRLVGRVKRVHGQEMFHCSAVDRENACVPAANCHLRRFPYTVERVALVNWLRRVLTDAQLR